MIKKKILVNLRRGEGDPLYDHLHDTLISYGFEVLKTNFAGNEMDELISRASGIDGIISGVDRWGKSELEKVKSWVKIICRIGVGVDNIDIAAANGLGIAVANTPGVNANAVAEGALALMLSLCRRICAADRDLRSNKWINNILCSEISGKTIGIIGYGNIGKRLVSLLSGFGCTFLVHDPFQNSPAAGQEHIQFSSLEDLTANSDIISLHLTASEKTFRMVNGDFLSSMKKSASLINTSRGSLVDEKALLRALKNGIIAGAALDVFEDEPLQDSELMTLDNVVITPHMLSGTKESAFNTMTAAAENLYAFFSGNPRNLITGI